MTDNTALAAEAIVPCETAFTHFTESSDLKVQSLLQAGEAFNNLRRDEIARLGILPFPKSNDELWRYTKPELFGFKRFGKPTALTVGVGSTLPKGVTVSHSFDGRESLLKDLLRERAKDIELHAESALQIAATTSVTVIEIAPNTTLERPIQLSQVVPASTDSDASAAALIVVSLGRGAKASIVEDLNFDFSGVYAPRVEILVGERAECKFISCQRLSDRATYLAKHRIHTLRDAKVRSIHLALGAAVSRVDFDIKMYEPGASVDSLALYVADGKRLTDFHPTQMHIAPHCHSDFFSKGVIKDRAHSVYYGFIRVAEGAQRTDAYQTNRNLVISAEARADSIPNLEIKANDVRCSHGASVGHVGIEDMFYLMSRGLSKASAEKILVQGFLEDLIARAKDESDREWLSQMVLERLDGNHKSS